jgi:hypothetical protein
MGRILDFFGVAAPAPAIAIETQINGQDADTLPGPTLTAGSSASFTYVLTNTGNVPISAVTVTDDNGTPGSSADDFTAAFTSGDSNSNGLLDVGETWTYTATRTVVAGQYSGIGSVTATGNAQAIAANDPVNFIGIVPDNADFNSDGSVDAADYVLWRNNDGTPSGATQSQGDANHDTAVDTADYNIWAAQFGTTPGAGTSTAAAATMVTLASPSEAEVETSPALTSVAGSEGSTARNVAFANLATHPVASGPLRRTNPLAAIGRRNLEIHSWSSPLNLVAKDAERARTTRSGDAPSAEFASEGEHDCESAPTVAASFKLLSGLRT